MNNLVRSLVAVVAAIALAAAPAAAQGWAVGFEGGLNISDLSIEPEDAETETELGFRGGGVLRYDFAPDGLIGIHTGVTYSRKGASAEGVEEVDLNLDYLEIPLTLAVNIPTRGSALNPRIYAGGSFNFEIDCSIAVGDADAEDCDDPTTDVLERNSFDFGLRFGAGLDIDIVPSAALTLDAGYELGLTDIDDTESSEAKNRNLFFAAGILFRP